MNKYIIDITINEGSWSMWLLKLFGITTTTNLGKNLNQLRKL